MKYFMGHFGEAVVTSTSITTPTGETAPIVLQTPTTVEQSIDTQVDLFTTVSNLAEGSVESSLSKAAQLVKTEEVQKFIKENNLEPYLKDINKERVKNVLALLGVWSVFKAVKSPVGIAVIAGIAGYAMFVNKDKLIDKISTNVSA